MSRRVLVGLMGLTAFVLAAPALVAQDQGAADPAYLNVKVPATAKLEIQGRLTLATGEMRRFVSPPLPAGKKYTYTVIAVWTGADGKEEKRSEEVQVFPGRTADVDFVTPKKADPTNNPPKKDAPKAADPPKKDTPPPPPPPVDTPKKDAPKKDGAADDKKKEKEDPDRKPDVIYVPTPQKVVDEMLKLANVKKEDVVYDLGCGDARIPVTAAKKFGCKAWGFDIDPDRIKDSNKNVEDNKVGELVTIEKKDIFTLDLSKANVVTLYLLPQLNVRLIPQLEKLKAGSRIVSHDFDMEGVKPDKVEDVEDDRGTKHKIYLWTTPLKKEKE